MTITVDQPRQQKPLSFDDFLDRYGGDNRYELIDGEVFDGELCIMSHTRRAYPFAKRLEEKDGFNRRHF
jgi:Uma2 family endonuclease